LLNLLVNFLNLQKNHRMKKFGLLVLIFCSILSSIFAQDKPAYHISVKMKGVEPDKYVHLAHYYGYNQYLKVDSAKAENGVLNFKGTEPLKGGIYLVVLSPSKYYDFVISGEETNFSFEADTTDYIKSVKFAGSKENDILFNYRKYLADKSDEAMAIQKQMSVQGDQASMELNRNKMKTLQEEVTSYMKNTVTTNGSTFAGKIIKANMEPELPKEAPMLPNGKRDSTYLFNLYKKKFFENIDFSDERMLRTPFLQSKVEKYFKDLVYQVTDSINVDADKVLKLSKKNKEVYRYVLWMVTNKYENIDIVGLDGVFIHLAEDYYLKDADWLDSTQRAKFQERVNILKPIQTGKIMPTLILSDTLGVEQNLNSLKAKYTIVYFYSPDCGHCKDHAPELVKYYDENKSRGIEVLNVAVDYDLEKIKKFVSTYKTGKMRNLWDAKGRYVFRNKFDIYSTPTSYILDSEKRILGKRIPIAEFNKFIEFHEKQADGKKKI
jgi:thiol-disulfide isomerase/thioredoxin